MANGSGLTTESPDEIHLALHHEIRNPKGSRALSAGTIPPRRVRSPIASSEYLAHGSIPGG